MANNSIIYGMIKEEIVYVLGLVDRFVRTGWKLAFRKNGSNRTGLICNRFELEPVDQP